MPSPAALLSANASLSAMPGGTAGIGSGSITAATGGTQATDFSSLLPTSADLVPISTAKPPLPSSAPDADAEKDSFIAPANDPATASSGKDLPLAALVSAALPVPVTLSALVRTPDTSSTSDNSTTGDGDQPSAPAPTIDITGANALALMAMAHGTTARQTPATPPATTTATTAPGCTGLAPTDTSTGPSFPTLALSKVQTAYVKDTGTGQTPSPLPQPGFTLLADITGDTATTQPATSASPLPQPSITLTAATAIAMADPAQLSTATAQPGFTLLADMTPNTDSLAMAPPNSTAGAAPRLAATTSDTGSGQETVTSASAATAARIAQTTSATTTPIFTAFPVVQPTDATSAPTAPVRLASARGNSTQGKVATVSPRNAAAGAASPPRPAIDLDADDPQPGFSAHSPTSPSADGAGMLDNAPSLTQPPASAGTAAVAQTLAATGGAATSTFATQQGGTDMAALVDRLVEARAAARSGLSSPVVQTSLTHSDFGRVSLRFNTDEDGLSVSMASSDPGFAPAAQAALAQAPAVSANAQSHGAGQQGSSQQGSGQPGLHWTQSSAQPALQTSTGSQGGMGGSSGQGGQGWAQGGQTSAPAGQNTPAAQARAAVNAATTSPRNRGGILA
jgi:hypothetical protein